MAVKKTTKKKEASAKPAKSEAKEVAPKKTAKKAAAPKAAAPEASASATTTPPSTSAASAPKKKAAPKKGAAKKAAAPPKLSASQGELLKKIGGAGEAGYAVDKKEARSIESLVEKKLIKKGAKDKATGAIPYHITSSGKKLTS
jgi:hypothetical protein